MQNVPSEHTVLAQLHHNHYSEELLSDRFSYVVWKILTRREREVLFQKIDGRSNREIADSMHISIATIRRYVYNIRSKFRNHLDTRVDNKAWAFFRRMRHGKITNVTIQVIVLLVLAAVLLIVPLLHYVCQNPIQKQWCKFPQGEQQ